nr:hypothetical protein [Streptomyces sp. AS58]
MLKEHPPGAVVPAGRHYAPPERCRTGHPRHNQAILGYASEAKWLRHARAHLHHLFPYLPQQPGYNKRPRKAADLIRSVNRILATTTSVWSDIVWGVDSSPVECDRSHEIVKRSDLAGCAECGHCASDSASSGACACPGLHLQGLPVAFALTGAKADKRQPLLDLLAAECELLRERPDRLSSATRTTSAVVSNANCTSMASS